MELAYQAIACQADPGLPPWEGNVFVLSHIACGIDNIVRVRTILSMLAGKQTMSRSHVLMVFGFLAFELRSSPFFHKKDEGRMADARLLY